MNYLLSTHSYIADFNGKFNFNNRMYGLVASNDIYTVNGWIYTFEEFLNNKFYYEVIVNGQLIEEVDIKFSPSLDVFKVHPSYSNSKFCRFFVRIDLKYLSGNDNVVIRFRYNKSKVYDIAFLILEETPVTPVFIIGSPRAAISALGDAIIGQTKNYSEHHTGWLWELLNQTIDAFFCTYHTRLDNGSLINDVSPSLLKLYLDSAIRRLMCTYHNNGVMVDKTPGRNMLKSIKTILRIWPNAKFIFVKQRALENVLSRLKKIPTVTFEEHCNQWVDTVNVWNTVKQHIPANSKLEIEQFHVAKSPADVSQKLSHFLNIEDKSLINDYLTANSPQSTENYFKNAKDLSKINWSEEQKSKFWYICGFTIVNEGYTVNSNYFQEDDVLVGKNGQLFIKQGANSVINQISNKIPLPLNFYQNWKQFSHKLSALSNRVGSKLIFLIAPEAHLVLSDQLGLSADVELPAVTQAIDIFSKENICTIFPVRELRRAISLNEKVWYTTDSHWNYWGAYLAYIEICRVLDVEPIPIHDDDFDKIEQVGDLGSKIGDGIRSEENILSSRYFKKYCCNVSGNKVVNRGNVVNYESSVDAYCKKKVLLIRDSYGANLIPFLSATFGSVLSIHSKEFDADFIERFNPELIIYESAARFVLQPPEYPEGDITYTDLFGSLGKDSFDNYRKLFNQFIEVH
jgi:hypothetical protein